MSTPVQDANKKILDGLVRTVARLGRENELMRREIQSIIADGHDWGAVERLTKLMKSLERKGAP